MQNSCLLIPILSLTLSFASSLVYADSKGSATQSSFLKKAGNRLRQIWFEGSTDLYLSGYAWHNRFTYTKAKINSFNEQAWGGGFGKGFYDEDGDWHGLYAIGFLDSHKNIEPAMGYAFQKMFYPTEQTGIGLGFTLIATSRTDILHSIPVAGILPWCSLKYRKFSLGATYIPGARGAGNVLYLLTKWTFDGSSSP